MLKIEFETDNAAYHFDGEQDETDGEAVADTVRHVASLLADGFTSGPIADPNGNTVGSWLLTGD